MYTCLMTSEVKCAESDFSNDKFFSIWKKSVRTYMPMHDLRRFLAALPKKKTHLGEEWARAVQFGYPSAYVEAGQKRTKNEFDGAREEYKCACSYRGLPGIVQTEKKNLRVFVIEALSRT